jgi:acid phosphatase (class A)
MIYGNPSYESVELIRNSILLREWMRLGVFEPLKDMPYPEEMETRQELEYLLQLQKSVDSPRLEYCTRVDEQLFEVMSEFLASYGITESAEQIYANIEVYEPIIDYLKVVYNRPRPFQTAAAYGIPLYPLLESKVAGSAAYPSGHTLFGLFFRHIYIKRHPELGKELMRFVVDVKLTREQGGVHYPSDGIFSMHIYKHIKPWMDARTTIYFQGLDNI